MRTQSRDYAGYTRQKGGYYVDENRWAVLHEYIASAAVKPKKLYRVQVGAFSSRENAEQYMNKVKAAGFGAFIVEVDNNA